MDLPFERPAFVPHHSAPRRWTFIVPGNPKPKERPRQGRAGSLSAQQKAERAAAKKRGERWIDPRRQLTMTPRETREYEASVAAAAAEAGLSVGDHPCSVTLAVWMPPADAKRKDLDNITKSVLDGMMKAGKDALADDCAAVIRHIDVAYVGSDDRPRVVVTVVELGQ